MIKRAKKTFDPTKYSLWLEDVLEDLGITSYALSPKCGVSQPTIDRIRSGESKHPDRRTIAKIEAVGNIPSPDTVENNLKVVSQESDPIKINNDQLENLRHATQFLLDNVGIKVMEDQGAEWTAKTIALLYELFHDPASKQLDTKTILRIID